MIKTIVGMEWLFRVVLSLVPFRALLALQLSLSAPSGCFPRAECIAAEAHGPKPVSTVQSQHSRVGVDVQEPHNSGTARAFNRPEN